MKLKLSILCGVTIILGILLITYTNLGLSLSTAEKFSVSIYYSISFLLLLGCIIVFHRLNIPNFYSIVFYILGGLYLLMGLFLSQCSLLISGENPFPYVIFLWIIPFAFLATVYAMLFSLQGARIGTSANFWLFVLGIMLFFAPIGDFFGCVLKKGIENFTPDTYFDTGMPWVGNMPISYWICLPCGALLLLSTLFFARSKGKLQRNRAPLQLQREGSGLKLSILCFFILVIGFILFIYINADSHLSAGVRHNVTWYYIISFLCLIGIAGCLAHIHLPLFYTLTFFGIAGTLSVLCIWEGITSLAGNMYPHLFYMWMIFFGFILTSFVLLFSCTNARISQIINLGCFAVGVWLIFSPIEDFFPYFISNNLANFNPEHYWDPYTIWVWGLPVGYWIMFFTGLLLVSVSFYFGKGKGKRTLRN